MEMLKRNYNVNLETKEEEEMGIVEGRPIVFDNRTNIGGLFDEIIERGALDKTDLTDVRLCLNHDTSFVYARSRRNNKNSTMKLFVDENGLCFRAKLDIKNSPRAMDYYSAIKRGDIDKMSFMFGIDKDDWEDLESEIPTRHIKSISTVVEISAVTFPAYDTTSITARDKSALENARIAVDTAKKSVETDLKEQKTLELLKIKNIILGGF